MDPSPKISVLMPAYNEGDHIFDNLEITRSVLGKLSEKWEIIVINDGSYDNTYTEAIRASNQSPEIQVVTLSDNQGKGSALRRGFREVSGDLVVFLDADLELSPDQLEHFLKPIKEKKADIVIGSKYHPLSQVNYPKRRKLVSWIYAKIVWLLFRMPLHDTQSGFKVFKKKALDSIFPKILCNRFAYDIEILANAYQQGYKIVEIPVFINYSRPKQWGRIGIKTLFLTGLDTLAIYYRMHILKSYNREKFSGDRG
ncbi:MAG: glycosyltransferase family 2 protein [Pseudomonadota bacterium]